jgi:hypothetical protein
LFPARRWFLSPVAGLLKKMFFGLVPFQPNT